MGRVFHEGTEIAAESVNGESVDFSVVATVAQNDVLDFAIDADGTDQLSSAGLGAISDKSDATTFTILIDTLPDTDGDGVLDRDDNCPETSSRAVSHDIWDFRGRNSATSVHRYPFEALRFHEPPSTQS